MVEDRHDLRPVITGQRLGKHGSRLDRFYILLLVKILLAFGVFYLSSLLAGRSETAKKFQADRGKWLKVTALMVIAIVLLGSVMKVSVRQPKSENDEATSQADDAMSSQTMIGRNG